MKNDKIIKQEKEKKKQPNENVWESRNTTSQSRQWRRDDLASEYSGDVNLNSLVAQLSDLLCAYEGESLYDILKIF